ncbi:hypothetical protein WA026_009020 [Henosepilachna vigintioctopunctata]|uniref:Cytochrome P450 n=1 Tax=Henosepilachna vigintioctopunctata TaxID=420089 RepID=A0AAW1UXQ6_9CUCU
MYLSTTVIFLATAVVLIWAWMKSKYTYWKRLGLITPPCTSWLGNVEKVVLRQESFADNHLAVYNLFKSQGVNHGGYYIMWTPIYVPININIIKSIMQNDFEHFTDRGLYLNEKSDPLNSHLINLTGKKWKLLRSKLSPTFTSGKMKMMHQTIVDCTTGLYQVMDKVLEEPVDIKDILARFTTDIIGSCAFGISCNSLENPNCEFREKGKDIFQMGAAEFIKQTLCFIAPDVMKFFNTRLLSKELNDFFTKIVTETVEFREKNNVVRRDFMHLLIQLKNKGKLVDEEKLSVENITETENKITLEELAAQAFIFFEAGFETSSTTMTFCLYELAKSKNIQERVRKEIKKVLSRHDGKMTYDAIMDMQYLEQVINETLRLHPSLPDLNRICTKTYKVPGEDLVLEKGMRVMIPVIGIHRDPEYYPDPDKFDPDRFSEENKKNRNPFTFIPFGEGPRICIGARFGMMQTKVGLTALLVNYEFDISEKTPNPLLYNPDSFILSTKGEMFLNVKRIPAV